MLEITNVQEINKAILVLRKLNADENMRRLVEMREKALHDEANAINSAEERGRIEGIEEGKLQIIEAMKKSGMTEEEIQNILDNKK